jgi:anthranilate synthase component 2
MILLIDNGFSHNLYQAIGAETADIKVIHNDALTVDEIKKLAPQKIILSAGSGKPANAGVCVDVVKNFCDTTPILGICLGHQSIFEAFGGAIGYASALMHGKASEVSVDTKCPLFANLPPFIQVGRYHSLSVKKETLPEALEIISQSDDGEIMGIRHKKFPVFGLQFHPDSFLTPMGQKIIENFLRA